MNLHCKHGEPLGDCERARCEAEYRDMERARFLMLLGGCGVVASLFVWVWNYFFPYVR